MKKLSGVLFIFFITVTAMAERIDGPANIRDTPKGRVTFSLDDNVNVEATPMQNDWFQIKVMIKLTKEQYEARPLTLPKGSRIYNMDGDEIGVALSEIKPHNMMTAGGAPGIPQWYAAELYGYTYKTNIRPESIIEPTLSQLVNSNKPKLTFTTFQQHLREFNYTDGLAIKDMPHLTTYMVFENSIDDPSPLDRVRLIFKGDDLIAIVHSRNLNLGEYETVEIARGRKLTILAPFGSEEKSTFIDRNIASYAGID